MLGRKLNGKNPTKYEEETFWRYVRPFFLFFFFNWEQKRNSYLELDLLENDIDATFDFQHHESK